MIKSTLSIQVLEASQGMMLTNGQTYSKMVYLGAVDSPDNWWEITEQEYEMLMQFNKEQQQESQQN